MKSRWDIFCKIVDNFGDIGVCWRLARQLQTEHGLWVRLWVDDLSAAQKIIPNLNIETNQQVCEAITINKWDDAADFTQAADVVIEAFACGFPEPYLTAMQGQNSKWINLEYLSAETWVDDFHAKPSPQANGLVRYFYFPGFTEATGGLLREKYITLLNQQDRTYLSPLKISLFCYPHAPIYALLEAMAESNQPIDCYVPASTILPKVAHFFNCETLSIGEHMRHKNLNVHVLPFLSQDDYDKLLATCDINFVRGEDSWIRAIWAAKPFIWQPYLQTENTHIKKLKAFIDVFYANYEQKEMLWKAHEYWAKEHDFQSSFQQSDFNAIWLNYINALQSIQAYTKEQTLKFAQQTDLATKLVAFSYQI
jgi:uncharacterized repeat protein (TIGR03837 family)